MHLRTFTLACALVALLAAPHGPTVRAGPAPSTPVAVRSSHEQPLPFLGSGGAVVQGAAQQSTPVPPLYRAGSAPRPVSAATQRARYVGRYALPDRDRAARIRACLLGTPPPSPQGRDNRSARSVTA